MNELGFSGKKVHDGASLLMANLSALAAWRADGTISSDDELKSEWLRLANSQ